MRVFTFGVYAVHLGRYELTRDGQAVALPRVPMEILILLMEKRGNLVTRQEIAAALWPGSDPADLVQSINTAVNRIRGVLRDDPAKPTYIQTVIGKGYRFVAPVEETVVEALMTPAAAAMLDRKASRMKLPANAEEQVQPTAGGLPTAIAAGVATLPERTPTAGEAVIPAAAATRVEPLPPTEAVAPVAPMRRGWWWTAAGAMRWWLAAGSAVILVATLLVAASGGGKQTAADLPFVPERLTDLASGDALTAGAISADGRRVAYADADGVTLQTLGDVATQEMVVPGVTTIGRLAWFPDGEHLLMSAETGPTKPSEVWLLSAHGGAPRRLREDAEDATPTPDGSQIAFTAARGTEVWVAGADGQGARRLIGGDPHQTFAALVWTGKGRQLLLARKRSPEANPSDRTATAVKPGFGYVSVDAATGRLLFEAEFRFNHACLLGGNRLLLSRAEGGEDGGSASVWEATIDPETGGFVETPQRLQQLHDQRVLAIDAARETGAVVATLRSGLPSVYVGMLTGGGSKLDAVKRLTFTMSAAYPDGWTEDGQSVMFESEHSLRTQIYQQRLDRHDPEAILNSQVNDEGLRPTPDGESVLFIRKQLLTSPRTLYRVALHGVGVPVPVKAPTPVGEFRCPRVGSMCVLEEMDGSAEMRFVRLDPITGVDGEVFAMPKVGGEQGDWDESPDGTELAMVLPEEATPTIQIVTLKRDGTKATVSRVLVKTGAPLRSLNWAADGRGWFVSTYNGAEGEIFYVDRTGRATPLRQTAWFSWAMGSPDGSKLAFVDEDVDSNLWLLGSKTGDAGQPKP